jgi:hypothetical protein
MQPEPQITVLGKRWRLKFVPRAVVGHRRDGTCDSPKDKNKTIHIAQSLKGERLLDVLIHEMLHAADWHKDEEWISTVASDMARALWRLGYRGPSDAGEHPRQKAD